MSKNNILKELKAAFLIAQAAYDTPDAAYKWWVRGATVDEYVDDIETFLGHPKVTSGTMSIQLEDWEVYKAAKTFVLFRDQGRAAAMAWLLVDGGAL
ncbi:hypothetical protein [Sphingomonas paucimobilis]|uniref:hypothetical protein n=1 Tax=Sphingomonas paucimobilis TaxID=13689 RepID=UPI0031E4771D